MSRWEEKQAKLNMVDVPLKPALAKFFTHSLPDSGQLSKKCDMGLMVLNMLQPKPFRYTAFLEEGYVIVQVKINPQYHVNRGRFISEENVYFLNQYVYRKFKGQMITSVDEMLLYSVNKQIDAIRAFYHKYDLTEEDIGLRSLIRTYQRVKERPKELRMSV